MGLSRYLAKLGGLVGSDGKVPAAGLASGAAVANIGYTPMDVSLPQLGSQTDAWHYIANTKLDGGAGQYRKAKLFFGNSAQVALKMRTNYGWWSGWIRLRFHEIAHTGGSYREVVLTGSQGTNGYLNANSYAPGLNNIQTIGGYANFSFACALNGGGIDVGGYDTTLTVTPEAYGNLIVDVEYWGFTETTSTPSKGQIQFL